MRTDTSLFDDLPSDDESTAPIASVWDLTVEEPDPSPDWDPDLSAPEDMFSGPVTAVPEAWL